MPSVRNVSNIKANLLRPATTSHFEVEIPLPPSTFFDKWRGIGKQDKIQLMCSEASLPGSNLATFDISNDRTGVTEKHVHRRIFDDRIDLTFYVDAGLYQPIKFFEEWIGYITNGRQISPRDNDNRLMDTNYFYQIKYPDSYIANQGLKVTKFERDHLNPLTYEFVRSFPLVQNAYSPSDPFQQSQFNIGGFLGNIGGGLVDNVVDRVTGSDLLGDIAGGIANQAIRDAL